MDVVMGHSFGADGARIVDGQFILPKVTSEVCDETSGRLDGFRLEFAEGAFHILLTEVQIKRYMDRDRLVHLVAKVEEMFVTVTEADEGLVARVARESRFLSGWRLRRMVPRRGVHGRVA